jgi:hypothetical protein
MDSKEEYALDLLSPPVINRLPNQEIFKERVKQSNRAPSKQLIQEWKGKIDIE